MRSLRERIAEEASEAAAELLPKVVKAIDKAVSKGVLHRNNASRHVSRLSSQVAGLKKAS